MSTKKLLWLIATWATLASLLISAIIGIAALAAKVAGECIHFVPQITVILWVTLFLLGVTLVLSALGWGDEK